MTRFLTAALVAVLTNPGLASACPDPTVAPVSATAPAVSMSSAGPAETIVVDTPFAGASPVSADDLDAVAGQADLAMVVRAQNTSTVSNNSVSGQSQTGAIRFDEQSLSNLNGLSLLSANTGNNVSINASLNVNIAIQP